MFFVAVALGVGIAAARVLSNSPLEWILAGLLFWAAAVYFSRTRAWLSFSVALLAIAMAGALAARLQTPLASPKIDPPILQGECTIVGHVIRDGLVRPGLFGGQQQSVDIETESIATVAGYHSSPRIGVRVSLYTRNPDREEPEPPATRPALPALRYGQRLQFIAKLHEPRNYKNPGAWDYRGYLQNQGIALTGSSNAATASILPGFSGSRWRDLQARARAAVVRKIHSLWAEEQAALLDAMLIGVRSEMGRDLKVDFQSTGTFHILVVSGMNVGIVAFAVFWLLRRVPTGDIAATLVTLTLAAGYAWLTDLGAPIIRAVGMLAIYLLTRLLYRRSSHLNAIGVAASAILLWDPRALFDPSFQLTFLSVLAIAGIGIPWMERTSAPYRRALRHLHSLQFDRTQPPRYAQFRLDLRMICERLERVVGRSIARVLLVLPLRGALLLWDLVLVSLLMEFALALPMAWYFHRATLLSPIANALVVPFTGVLMTTAAAALLLAPLSHTLAAIPAALAGWCLQLITGTVTLLGALRISNVRVPTPDLWMALTAALALAFGILSARRRWWIAASGTALLLLAGAVILFIPPTPRLHRGLLEVTALDVGQGDSLFIALPDGKTMLLDAGGVPGGSRSGFDVGEQVVSSYLWSRRIGRLDVVAYSHPHADHIGGMASVIRNFHPRELWYGFAPQTREVNRLLRAAREEGVRLRPLRSDTQFDYGGARFEVLSPALDEEPHAPPRDDDVLALRIYLGKTSALLIGDSPKNRELQMLARAGQGGLLKVAHHGSATSTTEELLTALQPEFAVISVGARNAFHHPRPEVLERLARHRVRTYRTDVTGASTFYLDGTRTSFMPGPR